MQAKYKIIAKTQYGISDFLMKQQARYFNTYKPNELNFSLNQYYC